MRTNLPSCSLINRKFCPASAFKPCKLCSCVNHVRFFQRKFEIGKAAFGNDKCEHVGILGARIGKIDFHGNKQPFRWVSCLTFL